MKRSTDEETGYVPREQRPPLSVETDPVLRYNELCFQILLEQKRVVATDDERTAAERARLVAWIDALPPGAIVDTLND